MPAVYQTDQISPKLLEEIKVALRAVKAYGSIEIYIQKGIATQITIRNIKKTNEKTCSSK